MRHNYFIFSEFRRRKKPHFGAFFVGFKTLCAIYIYNIYNILFKIMYSPFQVIKKHSKGDKKT